MPLELLEIHLPHIATLIGEWHVACKSLSLLPREPSVVGTLRSSDGAEDSLFLVLGVPSFQSTTSLLGICPFIGGLDTVGKGRVHLPSSPQTSSAHKNSTVTQLHWLISLGHDP